MGTLTGLDDLINKLTGGGASATQNIWFFRDNRVGANAAATPVAARVTSFWQYAGAPSADPTNPSSAVTCNSATTGSLMQKDATTAAGQNYILGVSLAGNVPGNYLLYDRLAQMGGLDATVITPQAVSMSLSRYTGSLSCVGNRIFIEVYTQVGATAVLANVTYKNQSGQTSVTPSASFGGAGFEEGQRLIMMPLAPGDTGVQSVDRVIISATTTTAGNFGVTVGRPLVWVPLTTVGGTVKDMITEIPSLTFVEAGACLAWAAQLSAATLPQFHGCVVIQEI